MHLIFLFNSLGITFQYYCNYYGLADQGEDMTDKAKRYNSSQSSEKLV